MPIVRRRSASDASRARASANMAGSSGGTRNSSTPLRTKSRLPGTSVTTSGRPQAAASSIARGSPSPPREARTKMSVRRHMSATSVTCPRQTASGRLHQAVSNSAGDRLWILGVAPAVKVELQSHSFVPQCRKRLHQDVDAFRSHHASDMRGDWHRIAGGGVSGNAFGSTPAPPRMAKFWPGSAPARRKVAKSCEFSMRR
jgi:hypothetical protein